MSNIKILCLLVLTLALPKVSAEELSVEVISLPGKAQFSWTISNELEHTEYASEYYASGDTATMLLSANQHCRINIQLDYVSSQDSDLLILKLNGAAIMLIRSDIGLGEFSYPFYTGIKEPVLKIVGGSNASIADFPWQVYMSSGDYMCGGSIISDKWILTAAHCTRDGEGIPISSSDMEVKVGTSTPYSRNSGKWYSVKSYTVHRAYNDITLRNDIAVLELYENIDFENAEVIDLLSEKDVVNGAIDPGVMSTVTGWGLSSVVPEESPSILQKVNLPIVSNAVASTVWSGLHSGLVMAGYENGNKDACNGDSGGPLTVEVDGKSKLAGIVSWGATTCDTYGAFTKVSYFLEWIEDQTGIAPGVQLESISGDLSVCFGTDESQFSTSQATTNTYEWELSPSEAGGLSYSNSSATVIWDDAFLGTAIIKVRAEIGGTVTSWRQSEIEVHQNTELHSFPSDTIICENDFFFFAVEAIGDDLEYLWYKDNELYETNTSGLLHLGHVLYWFSGVYYCVVKGSCGEVMSPDFDLTVIPNTEIEKQPEDLTVVQGKELNVFVEATGHDLLYQWFMDGDALEGENSESLLVAEANATNIGQYYAKVSGTCLTVLSDTFYVYVDYADSEATQARLWPSVAKNSFYVAVSDNELYTIEVFNNNGKLIHQEKNCSNHTSVNVTSWGSGNYFVRITSDNLTEILRLIKQ